MLNGEVFYHETIRKVVVGFGMLFSNIAIERRNKNGTVEKIIKVPLSAANKEKWYRRYKQDPELEEKRLINLPVMGFEVTNFQYDFIRKTPKMEQILQATENNTKLNTAFAPVPYNMDIDLYIMTKTLDDMLQIIEQILPYFTPEYTLSINAFPTLKRPLDVPIVLNNVIGQDLYDGDFDDRRYILYILKFTAKIMLLGPINKAGLIKKVIVDLPNQSETYTAQIDPFEASPEDNYRILEEWENNN